MSPSFKKIQLANIEDTSMYPNFYAFLVSFSLLFSTLPLAAAENFSQGEQQSIQATRVYLELIEEKPFQIFQLSEPYRVVIDFSVAGRHQQINSVVESGGLVKKVRQGRFNRNTYRVVLDCFSPVRVATTRYTNSKGAASTARPTRLLIELQPASAPSTSSVTRTQAHDDTTAAFAKRVRSALGRPVARHSQSEQDLSSGSDKRDPMLVAPQARGGLTTDKNVATILAPTPRPRAPVVVIDAGHGGKDPGAIGRSGLREKTVTLAVARVTRQKLSRLGRYKIVLTRDSDRYLRLRERIALARAVDADVFVSIHADSIGKKSVRGASVYTLSETASDAEAAALAERENKADVIDGVDLSGESAEVTNILIDLVRRDTMNRSIVLASRMVPELRRNGSLLRNPHRHAGFIVLKAADIPSVLVELGFLSNARDEQQLRTREHQNARAEAIARAIHGYLSESIHALGR